MTNPLKARIAATIVIKPPADAEPELLARLARSARLVAHEAIVLDASLIADIAGALEQIQNVFIRARAIARAEAKQREKRKGKS